MKPSNNWSGESNWGSPAFRVYSGQNKKARAVIDYRSDYRRVSSHDVGDFFVTPDSTSVKRASTGKRRYSTDWGWGFRV